MGKGTFAIVSTVALLVAWAGWHVLGLTLAALVIGGSYLLSVRVHPRTRHTGFRGCGGSGEHRGAIFAWSHRRCPGCDGGRLIRWGAGQFGSGHMKGQYVARRAARQSARERGTWR